MLLMKILGMILLLMCSFSFSLSTAPLNIRKALQLKKLQCCFLQGNTSPVDLKVQLPDKNVVTVSMPKNATAEVVFLAVIERIHLQKSSARYFYLFETVEDMFGKCTLKCSHI